MAGAEREAHGNFAAPCQAQELRALWVDAFHEGRLSFLGIVDLVERVVDAHDPEATSGGTLSRASLAEAERWAREAADRAIAAA